MVGARHLFARQGFHNTSISDIKKETGLPVGSIYTYFDSKDDIMATIIEDGWQELYQRVQSGFASANSPAERIHILTNVFFNDLVRDTDLIVILLTEAVELTRIAEKLDLIIALILQLLPQSNHELQSDSKSPVLQRLRTAVVVYFLGFLNAARLSQSGQSGIRLEDVQHFMKELIEGNLESLAEPLPPAL